MNAERLHAIALSLNGEIENGNYIEMFRNFVSSLQQVVNQPQNASFQQNLSSFRKTLSTTLQNANSNSFSPAWRQILKEINVDDLLGQQLLDHVDGIMAANAITPAVAVRELNLLQDRLDKFKNSTTQIIESFRNFHIGDEKLMPGECEIGLLIPRAAVKNQLFGFSNEIKELGFILNTFSEVATGKKDDLEIRTISSSELMVFLKATAEYSVCVAMAIKGVIELYKQVLKFRKIYKDLVESGMPEEKMKEIKKHADQVMTEGIDTLTVEIVDAYYKGDSGRKNELKNAVRVSLKKMANRIDRGYNIEVRVERLPDKEDEKTKETNKNIETIKSAVESMQYMNLEGTPLLSLPETESVETSKGETIKRSHSKG